MINNKTYNEIIQHIKLFAFEHMDIYRFVAEDEDQLSVITSKAELFPMVFVSPVNNRFDWQIDNYVLRIYCYDRVMKDRSNVINAQSRTNQILNDLNIWLRKDPSLPFEIETATSIYPFSNQLMTQVTGWYMDVTLSVPSYSYCDIPFENKPKLPIGVCEDSYAPRPKCTSKYMVVEYDNGASEFETQFTSEVDGVITGVLFDGIVTDLTINGIAIVPIVFPLPINKGDVVKITATGTNLPYGAIVFKGNFE